MAAFLTIATIVALCAWIARLLGRGWISLGLVLLLGAMFAQAPGLLGDLTHNSVGFVIGIPHGIATVLS